MHGQKDASTPEEYLALVEESRRDDLSRLHEMIRNLAPTLEPRIQIGILAYGWRKLKYANGKEQDWMKIGLAANKSAISLYLPGEIVERHKERLGKASCGQSCVRFKRLKDLDADLLETMIREAG